ncbi:unnamed protein product [Rotaria sp. Silwood1]|nr:unnamed protein product [Rotaria sp. Silwood1]
MGNKPQSPIISKSASKTNTTTLSTQNCTSSSKKLSELPNGVSIIWLNADAQNDSNDGCTTKTMLRLLHSSVFFYTDIETCLAFIRSIKNKQAKVFLIVSGSLSLAVLPNLDTHPAIDSVFIFCNRPERYKHLIDEYKPYVINVFTNQDELESSLRSELDGFQLRQLGMNFFAQKQSTTRDLTYDAASFLWFQLLKSTLVLSQYNDKDKNLMLNYCRHHYARDRARDKFYAQIDAFDRDYTPEQAIMWYTKNGFIYKLVNAALRTEDVDALYIFRFFIADLCRQLFAQHKIIQQQCRNQPIITLFRGCRMPREEIEKLKEHIGGMTSLNGFISTSYKECVAEKFMNQRSRQSDAQKVLFEITADTQAEKVVFASIGKLSDYPDEEEVLFSLASAFIINDVTLDNATQMWHIKMTATDVGAKAADDYISLIHKEYSNISVTIIFGQLLIDMGKYLTAQKYFLELLQRIQDPEDPDLGHIHYNLGLTYTFQKELNKAEQHLLQAYEYQKLMDSQKRDVVRTQNALGWVYQDNGELEEAMKFYKNAEKIGKHLLDADHLANAQTYSNMGNCHLERSQFEDARKCYNKALRILQIHLPRDHPRVGVILNDLGNVSRKETDAARVKGSRLIALKADDWNKTLDLYRQAEQIFCSHLPIHHPCTAYCWSCMGLLYLRENNIDQARFYHAKALKSYRLSLPADHINIEISEQNLKCSDYQRVNDSYLRGCSS